MPRRGSRGTTAPRPRLGEDVLGYAHAVKIDALAGLGKLLAEQPKAKGSDSGGRRSRLDGTRAVPSNMPPTLAEMGIDKRTSSLLDLDARRPRGVQPAVESRIELWPGRHARPQQFRNRPMPT